MGGRLGMSGRRASGGSGSNSSSSFLGRPVLCPEMPSLSLRSASSLADSAAFLRDPPHYISSSPLQQPAGLRTVDIRPVLLSLWGSQLIRADALLCRRRCDGTCGSTQLGGDACCSNGWVCAHTVMVAACSAADGPCQPQTCGGGRPLATCADPLTWQRPPTPQYLPHRQLDPRARLQNAPWASGDPPSASAGAEQGACTGDAPLRMCYNNRQISGSPDAHEPLPKAEQQ